MGVSFTSTYQENIAVLKTCWLDEGNKLIDVVQVHKIYRYKNIIFFIS